MGYWADGFVTANRLPAKWQSFEGTDVPTPVQTFGNASVAVQISTDAAKTGNHSLKFTCTGVSATPAWWGATYFVSPPAALVPVTLVNAWVYPASRLTPFTIIFFASNGGGAGTRTEESIPELSQVNAWNDLTFEWPDFYTGYVDSLSIIWGSDSLTSQQSHDFGLQVGDVTYLDDLRLGQVLAPQDIVGSNRSRRLHFADPER